jgi:chorismate mutase
MEGVDFHGIRGAVQASADTPAAIEAAGRELLAAIVERNALDPAAIVAIWFTQTDDLTAGHAPAAARALGWNHVPLLGAREPSVAGDLPRVVRVLVLARTASEARHVYLGETRSLRPDLQA